MEVPKPDIAAPDAVHNVDAVRRVGTGVTTLRDIDVGEITPIATRKDAQARPKSLDEPFKTRYYVDSAARHDNTDSGV